MIKLLGTILFVMGVVGLFILYLGRSDMQSKKSLLTRIGLGTIYFVVAALLLLLLIIIILF